MDEVEDVCDKCRKEPSQLHTCPYRTELNDDYETLCNCCRECRQLCAEDV